MAPRILVVDDVAANVRLLEAVLAANGYEVVTASSGAEALEAIVTQPPDLMLLDVQMPGLTGYEVCARVRHDPANAFLPIVMVTSSA
ncbi:MAG: response regulator, partial [Candidatus Limnocylindrales bacterium]